MLSSVEILKNSKQDLTHSESLFFQYIIEDQHMQNWVTQQQKEAIFMELII